MSEYPNHYFGIRKWLLVTIFEEGGRFCLGPRKEDSQRNQNRMLTDITGSQEFVKKKRVFRTSGIRFLTTFNTLAVGERCPVVSFVGKCCVITGIWKIKEFSKWLQLIAKGTREFLHTFHFKCEPRGGTGWIIRRWSGLLGHVVGEMWISATNFHVRNSVQQLPGLIRVERSGIPREIHG